MLARLQKSVKDKDQGFTLIELLVVIVIIGILAAIAIPIFLSQREKGVDSSMKSDLKNAATLLETETVDGPWSAAAAATVLTVASDFKASPDNVVTFGAASTEAGYCLQAVNTGGSQTWVYDSTAGGLQPSTVTAC